MKKLIAVVVLSITCFAGTFGVTYKLTNPTPQYSVQYSLDESREVKFGVKYPHTSYVEKYAEYFK